MKRTTRILCLLLALCCMLPMLPGLRLEANAYAAAKPLPELTGNKGQDVANIAISQLGYREGSDGGTVYGAWWSDVTNWGYNYTTAGWCSMFAMWCAAQAGAGMDIAFDKRGAVPANCMNWLLTNASGDTTFSVAPAPGDFIFFSTGSTAQHVAIVVSYDSATNKVTFVGGNQGNAVTQFTMSYTSSALFGSQRIIAIGRPKYGQSVIVPTCGCDEAYAGYYECITKTDPLNMRGGHGTGYSVVGSIPPGAIVYVSKAQGVSNSSWAHVEYNGVKGYCSMQYLKRRPEYSVEVIYDDHTGEAAGANVEIFDYVTVYEMSLTLPEQFAVSGSVSPVIHISAKDGFLLNLEIPISGDHSCVTPMVLDALGQAVPLEEYTFTDVGICVTVAGSIEVQLLYNPPMHTHSYSSQVTTQPTCESKGVRTYSCSCGSSYTEDIAPLGHSYTSKVTAPTCTAQGYTTHTCTRCGKSYTDSYTPATGHSYECELTKRATCEEKGLRTYTCSCGRTFTEEIDPLGHSYTSKVTNPTCTAQGYTTHTCTRCGKSYVDSYTPATGHSYECELTKRATCEEKGLRTYTCSCGRTFTEEIAPLGHSYTSKVTAPTCTAQGYTTHTCTQCGKSYIDSYTKATGHSYQSAVTKAPTCEKEGVLTYTCACGDSYTESIAALGHSYVNGKCEHCGEDAPNYVPPEIPDGFHKSEDGQFYYYRNGEVAANFTGLVANTAGNWYVKNGIVQLNYNGLITFNGTKYLIKGGNVLDYTGITKQEGVYYYFNKGVNDLDFEGLVLRNGMKAYVRHGEVDFNKTAVVEDAGKKVLIKYGIWRDTYKGLARLESGDWIYMENGTFDASYTGVAKMNSTWVYVADGYVDFGYTGSVTVNGTTYQVKYGIIQF